MFGNHDPAAAREHTAACRAAARARGWVDLEIGALALDGLAFVTEGDPAAGRRCLDEAMAAIVGGEVSDLAIMGLASCHVIAACERTHDYERAAHWASASRPRCRFWSDINAEYARGARIAAAARTAGPPSRTPARWGASAGP